ncbi:flagellar assembly peptidoglycan hydrolase FlgJ [Vibrio albus]|uniref:Peptidoglycan hydrolase FlgJ n=1 Tax=Vibrio albus TaxID=2200953 RepID=A0A2U3BED3_9VIBR|nr:flagellar assembly peptidoglycan hydrolase FlgJ [Vibrio albus]PWI35122.1 flagellar assembly peptidoglycan hydrolase FlgJ [Vibrio albus]
MVKNANDIGFIHDIASLDKLRRNAINGDKGDEKAALKAAAKQFESIFTNMLFKSMRDANATFESDLMKSPNQDFYRQMRDEQMASELSASGSLGLADMIVAQLGAGMESDDSEVAMREAALSSIKRMPVSRQRAEKAADDTLQIMRSAQTEKASQPQPSVFESPEHFVQSMKPYAEKAAKSLGVDPSLLLAQAALETGWGQKVVKNSQGSSNNLFNIKADRSWKGDKVATQTLEFHDNVPVQERAAFRSYPTYQESFNDFVRFLNQNPRYETALAQNGNSESFIRGIHKAGYATDPNYADKVLNVKARIDRM